MERNPLLLAILRPAPRKVNVATRPVVLEPYGYGLFHCGAPQLMPASRLYDVGRLAFRSDLRWLHRQPFDHG